MRPGRRRMSRSGCDPHPVRRPGAADPEVADLGDAIVVAILTRSEDRVQRRPVRAHPAGDVVAILTRSEDRVQRATAATTRGGGIRLRSSPGPKTGCSTLHRLQAHQEAPVAILTRSEDRVQHRCRGRRAGDGACCDPHPVRRPGAARACSRRSSGCDCCDPHPVRRPGAALAPAW